MADLCKTVIVKDRKLEVLSAKMNNIGPKGAASIATLIDKIDTLEQIRLNRNRIRTTVVHIYRESDPYLQESKLFENASTFVQRNWRCRCVSASQCERFFAIISPTEHESNYGRGSNRTVQSFTEYEIDEESLFEWKCWNHRSVL